MIWVFEIKIVVSLVVENGNDCKLSFFVSILVFTFLLNGLQNSLKGIFTQRDKLYIEPPSFSTEFISFRLIFFTVLV